MALTVFCMEWLFWCLFLCMMQMGKDETYEILNVLEFTSSRKRMSVIVRMPDNSIKLMIKGAVNLLQAEKVIIFNNK